MLTVIGDSLASHLARGLDVAFADTPDLRIETEISGASGLVRDDYLNWPETLAAFSAARIRRRRSSP
ncbi:hypothetical protein A6302_03960 [Methylobrevis pamukkalensis]|uniref:SGNH hydrolase-type esterase domain-containing protein n=1 Tax=Methylobrevis pamukkalensis TaxID=1439726 RepID=A0A1E3GXE3_9HYPH|nr:hypothetical protein A6302_03960 [Methylobrevis pamukkalensis]